MLDMGPQSMPLSLHSQHPEVPSIIKELQSHEPKEADVEQRLSPIIANDIAVLQQLGQLDNAPQEADTDCPQTPNINSVAKHLLRAFCKLCDQSLFLLVEWAGNAPFF